MTVLPLSNFVLCYWKTLFLLPVGGTSPPHHLISLIHSIIFIHCWICCSFSLLHSPPSSPSSRWAPVWTGWDSSLFCSSLSGAASCVNSPFEIFSPDALRDLHNLQSPTPDAIRVAGLGSSSMRFWLGIYRITDTCKHIKSIMDSRMPLLWSVRPFKPLLSPFIGI